MAGLYIHIPFCGSRCAYCDFYSTTSPERIAEYLEALKREMTARKFGNLKIWKFENEVSEKNNFQIFKSSNLQISTIYIGGGTPSLLSPEQLQDLLDHTAGLWDCSGVREITLEANPEDLTDDYLARLCSVDSSRSLRSVRNDSIKCHPERGTSVPTRDLPYKINRLSIGIQSFDDGLLRLMNRRHDAARAKEAVRAAQRAGFDNISIDLIYGIPGMSAGQWERTLDEAVALGVQHISAYHLTIEPGTAFANNYELRITNYDEAEKNSEMQFGMLREKLGAAGFEHYEISNFALPGRRAVHNSAYWSGEPYLGVGPSAHSFDGYRRREWVTADIQRYMEVFGHPSLRGHRPEAIRPEAIHANENLWIASSPAASRNDETASINEGETLSDRELANECIMTALRTADGIELYESRHCEPPGRSNPSSETGLLRPDALAMASRQRIVEKFLRDGLLVRRGDRIAIPPEKFLLSDYIIASLFD